MPIKEFTREEKDFLSVVKEVKEKPKRFLINIPDQLFKQIEKDIKQSPIGGTKTQWMLDAFNKKLSDKKLK